MSAPPPLVLPSEFNPATALLARTEDTGVFHASRLGAEFARQLVANGTPADLALAGRVLASVLACQETRTGDPHRGNFRWEFEDEGVEDLNAVHFVLIDLLPMLVRHGDRIPSTLHVTLHGAVRLALDEIARIDVSLDYTNIVLKDITNTLLGAQVLGCEQSQRRGEEKFSAWLALTARTGGVYELNSPAYTPIALRVLHELATHTDDPAIAVRARTAAARLGLTYALRILAGPGRLAGPYCRAYRFQVLGDKGPECELFESAVQRGWVPAWMRAAVSAGPLPGQLVERYDADHGHVYTTWLDRDFALGTATGELRSQANRYIAGQSNVFTFHFGGANGGPGGVIFTRYILDEKWLGDYRTTPARTSRELLLDEGRFWGVQQGPRMLGVYAPRTLGGWEVCRAAKLVFVVSRRAAIDQIAVDGVVVTALPHACRDGATIVLGCGAAWLAVRLVARTDLGRDAPIRLVEREGDLVIEIYNYLGPAKTFWELATPGSFYAGQPCCGFYAEVASRAAHADAAAFGACVATGILCDTPPPPATHDTRSTDRLWTVEYARDGATLGLEVDLMDWALRRRWTEEGPLAEPALAAPAAAQRSGGVLEVGGARLESGGADAWLFANPAARVWAAGGFSTEPTTLALTTPEGVIQAPDFRAGTLVRSAGENAVDIG